MSPESSGDRFALIATSTFGLESVVARELDALGYEARTVRPGWLRFAASAEGIARANLWLRAADRVLIDMGAFEASDFGALFDGARAIPWERLLPQNAAFPVRGRSVKSKLTSVPACQSIVKKAIVERLRDAHGVRELPEDGPSFPVGFSLLRDEATLTLDTTGEALHKRGYRPVAGEAPLKETLAAGLVLLSVWNRERPFLDPFCGTGTLPIEAGLIARNRAPGLLRRFAFETWPTLPDLDSVRARARDEELGDSAAAIEGSDQDPSAVARATESARRAGLDRDVRFEIRAFGDVAPKEEYGCLVTNPPYGSRLETESSARALYRSFPDVLRRFSSWSHHVLTSERDFERLVGQKADRRRKLYNGRIECTYYQFLGPRPGSETRRPAFGGMSDKGHRQAELLARRLLKRARHFRKWPAKRGTDSYRLYDRDIKEIPLSVDRYGELVLVTPGSVSTRRTPAEQSDWLEAMARAAGEALGLPRDSVLVAGRGPERSVSVSENGLRFIVRLGGEGPTGLPLSGRLLREKLRGSNGRRVLLVSTDICAYAVPAVAGSAQTIVGVCNDPGPQRDWTRRNLRSNDLPEDTVHVGAELPAGAGSGYDFVLVDEIPDRLQLERLLALLAPEGELYAVCAGRHRLPEAQEITTKLLPEDFRGRRRIRIWLRQKGSNTHVVE